MLHFTRLNVTVFLIFCVVSLLVVAVMVNMLLTTPVHAQISVGIDAVSGADTGLRQEPSVASVVRDAIVFLAGIVAALSVLMIVISGIIYMTSQGDTSRLERAKSMLLYAIIGLVVALLAWVIVNSIAVAFGVGGS